MGVDYHAPYFSISFLFSLTFKVGLFLIPLLLMVASDAFWIKLDTFREQPRVLYKHECLVLLEGAEVGETYVWSTFPVYNTLAQQHVVVPVIRSTELDTNDDGYFDEVNLNVEFPVQGSTEINRFRIVLFFDYKLKDRVDMQMQTLGIVD